MLLAHSIKIVSLCLSPPRTECVLSEGYPADSVARGTETLGGHKSLSLKTAHCVRIAVAA